MDPPGEQVRVPAAQPSRRASREGEREAAGMAVEQELNLVEKFRDSLHLVHEGVLMGAARGEEGACEGLGIARQPEALAALLEIDEQIGGTREQPEERGLARLPGAEDQPGFSPGRRPTEGGEKPPRILHRDVDSTPESA